MNEYKIKIYVANEEDTLDSICESNQIEKNILLIFNPLLKNKKSIKNLPIKIPYLKEKQINEIPNQERVIFKTDEKSKCDNKLFCQIKNYILYQSLINYKCETIIKNIDKETSCPIKKEYFNNLFILIDNFNSLDQKQFLEHIDKLSSLVDKLNNASFDDCNKKILLYLNLIKSKKYEEGEQISFSEK